MSKLSQAFQYVRNGTILYRIAHEYQRYAGPKRRAQWKKRIAKREYLDKAIAPGVKMRLYKDSVLSEEIYCGDFERKELRFLKRFLRPDDIFFDIGSNVGLFSLMAVKCIGKKGQIHAFEPCEKTYSRFLENIALNRFGNINARKLALSDNSGTAEMTTAKDGYDAWNSLAMPTYGTDFSTQNVQTETLDRYVEEHNLAGKIALMKIDVEGWEAHVLQGGRKTLLRADAPFILIEFTEGACQAAGSSCKALYGLLQELGYKMHVYNPMSNTIIADPLRQSYPYVNLIAAKCESTIFSRINNC